MKYGVLREYINIEGYSPFCHVNEISPAYQKTPFMLPFVLRNGRVCPVHPDTFHDLGLDKSEIVAERMVYPTSSFRTVYDPKQNVFLKVPVLRRITRGIRDLPNRELIRSNRAGELLSKIPFEGFSFMPEECHFADDPNFNYIKRRLPNKELLPWFYVISSQKFDKEFELNCVDKIIRSWMFYASKGLLLEYHTQNILVSPNAELCYRDLSDVRSATDLVLSPDKPSDLGDMLATVFDRAVCNQNLNHLFRYDKRLTQSDRNSIKALIASEIAYYGLPFPAYSMDFPKDSPKRVAQKIDLVDWRDFR